MPQSACNREMDSWPQASNQEGITSTSLCFSAVLEDRQVAEAYIACLESLEAQGKPLISAHRSPRFFLSRIDALLDPILEKTMADGQIQS